MSNSNRSSKQYARNNKETVSRYSRKATNNIEPLSPLLPSSRSRHSSSSQTSSSSHERRVVVESEEKMLSSNNICHWIQSATQKYDELKADHDELKARHAQLIADFHKKSVDNERLKFHIEQLEEENAGHRQEYGELQKIARDHANQCVPLRNEWKTTQAKLKETTDELRKKRDEKRKLFDEIKKLNSRKAALSSSNQSYEARERKMKTDLEKLSNDVEKEKKEKEQLQAQLGAKNEEVVKLRESNQKLDVTVHRLVQFVNDDIIQENEKMLMMFIATQKGTVSAMKMFMEKYNNDIGTEKMRAEGWGKLQIPHSKSVEELEARAIMHHQENSEIIKSTSCDDEDASGAGTTAKRGAGGDGNGDQGADDNSPLKRSRMTLLMQNDDDEKSSGRGEEEQQTGKTLEQQFELPVESSISVEDGNTGNGFHVSFSFTLTLKMQYATNCKCNLVW